MYIHQLLTHSTSAQPSTSKWQCSSENRTSDDEEELEVVGDAFHKEDMLQSKPVESQRSSPESDFMSMDGIAQLNLNGKTSIPPLNQPKATRPDHLDDVFVRDTESDDGYTELLSIPEIDSYGYSKPKPPVPQCTEQSDAGPSPFTSSHQYSISHRPPAPLPHSEGMTPVVNMQPFSRERGYHYSLKRVRSHSDGNLSRYSDICECVEWESGSVCEVWKSEGVIRVEMMEWLMEGIVWAFQEAAWLPVHLMLYKFSGTVAYSIWSPLSN